MLLANQRCQLVRLRFMQLVLVPISLVATPNYVLLATAGMFVPTAYAAKSSCQ